jgi:class 3 adenylate cyclase
MASTPTGTVTFLFTDVEGSTRLAREWPELWEATRSRHHQILREAIVAANGYVFHIIGDAFCAAFSIAGEALDSAIRIQLQLSQEDRGEIPVKVRIGIHTGKAEIQEGGDYHGYLTMSYIQRLMSAAHGGQVLLSQPTHDLVQHDLPESVMVRDLGKRRLKDQPQPENIISLTFLVFPRIFRLLEHSTSTITIFLRKSQVLLDVKKI